MWSVIEGRWVVGTVVDALGDDEIAWAVALCAAALAHVLVWALVMVPFRYLAHHLMPLHLELLNLPQLVRQGIRETHREIAQAQQSPGSAVAMKINRKLSLAGLGLSAALGVIALALWVVTEEIPLGAIAFSLTFLCLASTWWLRRR